MIVYLLVLFYCKILCVHIFLGNIKLLFSEKSGVWSNGTVVFGLTIESASCLKLSISYLIIVFLVSSSSQSCLLSFNVTNTISYLANFIR